uniref:Uncharacterized protein n=1 Tax=Siphoviridae sp. ctoMB99 TaxID=2826459 RepID=A0A8S5MZS7_9CAUD|nr:MAG TPA: hypothetical protein [Siphoviridae sp. ctoMB99]
MLKLNKEDIELIRECLDKGNDCRIQRTKDGYRIVSDSVRVLKKITCEAGKPENR